MRIRSKRGEVGDLWRENALNSILMQINFHKQDRLYILSYFEKSLYFNSDCVAAWFLQVMISDDVKSPAI